jgi:hypothetical protein
VALPSQLTTRAEAGKWLFEFTNSFSTISSEPLRKLLQIHLWFTNLRKFTI